MLQDCSVVSISPASSTPEPSNMLQSIKTYIGMINVILVNQGL